MRGLMLVIAVGLMGFVSAARAAEAQDSIREPVAKSLPAVESTLALVAASQVHARDDGAIGDGVADDTAAIQAAAEAAVTEGPICSVPAGHDRLNGALLHSQHLTVPRFPMSWIEAGSRR